MVYWCRWPGLLTHAAAIRAAPVPTGRERWREQLARGVELEEAIATGSAGGMLGRLDPLGAFSDYESSMFSPFYSLAAERHARAGLLEEAGRPEEALVAYASFEHFNLFDRVYAASANLRAGALLEDLGRAREAEARYRRVLVLYTDPDPPLRELRRQQVRRPRAWQTSGPRRAGDRVAEPASGGVRRDGPDAGRGKSCEAVS